MTLSEAQELINAKAGYRVSFEERDGGMLRSNYFPDRDEPGFKSADEAWEMARRFAAVDPGKYVNVFVIGGGCGSCGMFTPVAGYNSRALNRYPAPPEAAKEQ